MRFKLFALLAALLALPALGVADSGVVVAVASSVLIPGKQIASAFEKRYHTTVKLVPGSTGMLYSQIMHGAPYGVFMAADDQTPSKLRVQLGTPSAAIETYVTGQLYICAQSGEPDLSHVSGRVAIADPRFAPYGRAAKEALSHLSEWSVVKRSVIYAPNVMMAATYLARGLVATAFVASSAITSGLDAQCEPVDHALYAPIRQQALLLSGNTLAREWFAFIRGPEATSIWERAGFLTGGR
jgi:molybdate transport system substrate-binding protein